MFLKHQRSQCVPAPVSCLLLVAEGPPLLSWGVHLPGAAVGLSGLVGDGLLRLV